MVTSIKTKKGAEALAFSNKLETLRKRLLNDYIMAILIHSTTDYSLEGPADRSSNKMLCTCVASILSRWNWHIFPRAETALSYAITLSECIALGCLITTSNLERASVNRQKMNCLPMMYKGNNSKDKANHAWGRQRTSNKRLEHRSTKLSTNSNPINSCLKWDGGEI